MILVPPLNSILSSWRHRDVVYDTQHLEQSTSSISLGGDGTMCSVQSTFISTWPLASSAVSLGESLARHGLRYDPVATAAHIYSSDILFQLP